MYYVMEIAEYGELFNIIDATPIFSEKLARHYFKQLINGIEQLRNCNIAHRDIKSENILIDKNFSLKICDFGFSTKDTDNLGEKILFDSC